MKQKNVVLVLFILILAGGFAYWQSSNPVEEDNLANTNQTEAEIDTSDWIEYNNLTLGYSIQFPSEFKAYSEMMGEEVELMDDDRAIFMNNKNKSIGFMISQSSLAGDTIDQAFNKQVVRGDTNDFYINNNYFIYDKYTKHYFVKTNSYLLVIQFLANTEGDRKYISDLVLNSFELID